MKLSKRTNFDIKINLGKIFFIFAPPSGQKCNILINGRRSFFSLSPNS